MSCLEQNGHRTHPSLTKFLDSLRMTRSGIFGSTLRSMSMISTFSNGITPLPKSLGECYFQLLWMGTDFQLSVCPIEAHTCAPLLDNPILTLTGIAALVLSPALPETQYCVVCTSLKRNLADVSPGSLMTLELINHVFDEDYLSLYLLS